jgi:hypothetical protein
LDELPQLLNILVGDMLLIGPRPLLPRDQPKNIEIRLMVRPGITGWAQVNGGILLNPEEKQRLSASARAALSAVCRTPGTTETRPRSTDLSGPAVHSRYGWASTERQAGGRSAVVSGFSGPGLG